MGDWMNDDTMKNVVINGNSVTMTTEELMSCQNQWTLDTFAESDDESVDESVDEWWLNQTDDMVGDKPDTDGVGGSSAHFVATSTGAATVSAEDVSVSVIDTQETPAATVMAGVAATGATPAAAPLGLHLALASIHGSHAT